MWRRVTSHILAEPQESVRLFVPRRRAWDPAHTRMWTQPKNSVVADVKSSPSVECADVRAANDQSQFLSGLRSLSMINAQPGMSRMPLRGLNYEHMKTLFTF